MTTRISAPKGVPEYLPPDSATWLAIRPSSPVRQSTRATASWSCRCSRTFALFVRGVGESTDVVSKEMYTFTDRGDRSLTSPRGARRRDRTSSKHGLDRGPLPVKLWYSRPVLPRRALRAGRYRQFHSFGIEAVGSDDPFLGL